MAGFRVKKFTGLKLTLRISTGITGKSSMRGTWRQGFCQWVEVGIRGIEREGESEVRGRTGTYVIDAELDEDYEVGVDDGVFAGGPGADAGAAAGLVGVLLRSGVSMD